ncbi:complement C1q-like protein 4 [Embiotoca jacksoni]|uniref:complement C1q-like protein 4 n=1 Tax=Embiotoca jacksoni TaxID=100190 RepID=UPI0037037F2A
MDKFACGCCAMLQEVNKIKMQYNASLIELEKEYTKTKHCLEIIESSRIAFTATLFASEKFRCFGDFNVDMTIRYELVFLNLGGAYNASTGIFTVPRSGVYSITVTAYSDAGSPGRHLAACASLLVNGKAYARVSEENAKDQEDSATMAVALSLMTGDKVYVNLSPGCSLCDEGHYNTFSGFLLYSNE